VVTILSSLLGRYQVDILFSWFVVGIRLWW
jgi:hypothetical protein